MLKEVKEGEAEIAEFVEAFRGGRGFMNRGNSAFEFSFAEFVVSVHKNRNYRIECFELSIKTTATTSKSGNVMAQVGVDSLHCKSVIFVVRITNMLSRVNNRGVRELR